MEQSYVSGAGGFIGRHLLKRLPNAVSVPRGLLPINDEAMGTYYWLASYGNLHGQKDAQATLSANLYLPLTLAIGWKGKLVYVSTSSVKLPVQTLYSRCKAAAETVLFGLPGERLTVCVARPYSVTGVGEQSCHLIPTLIRSCLDGEPMELYPDATHDYVDVEDVVDGLLRLGTQRESMLVEFGKGWSVSNAQVKNMVEAVTGCRANVKFVGRLRSYDCTDWCCRDFSGAERIGWKATKTLEQSVREMVEAHKKQ